MWLTLIQTSKEKLKQSLDSEKGDIDPVLAVICNIEDEFRFREVIRRGMDFYEEEENEM